MDDQRDRIEATRVVADALEDAHDGPLDPERLAHVRELLRSSPQARRYYLQANALSAHLAAHGRVSIADNSATNAGQSGRLLRRPRAALVAGSLLALVAVAVTAWILSAVNANRQIANAPGTLAWLEGIHGTVTVTDAGMVSRIAEASDALSSGDTVRTKGALSTAVLKYADGTRVSLVGETSLTLSGNQQKQIVLHGGTLIAAVAPQASDRPMLVATPQDEVRVVGTAFSLDVTPVATDLSVNEGVVRLTRLRDRQSVEVLAGQRVVSNAAALSWEEIPTVPDEWGEDFENGLPENWDLGQFTAVDLPDGSRGAVKAVRDVSMSEGSTGIATAAAWTHGLFAVHEDTHLHFTLKMRDPGWFNILLLTRTAGDGPPTFAGNYIFDKPIWSKRPDAWSTVTIPLSQFRPLAPAPEGFADVLPFQLLFSSPERDRGLVIDRVWVTRGGPGVVQVVEQP